MKNPFYLPFLDQGSFGGMAPQAKPDDTDLLAERGRLERMRQEEMSSRKQRDEQLLKYQQELMKTAPLQVPQRQQLSGRDIGLTALGDFLREIASNAPRSQRQDRPAGAQVLSGIKDQNYQQSLQDAMLRQRNAEQALLGSQRAAEAGFQGAQSRVTESAQDVEGARGDVRFERQFTRQAFESDRDYTFRVNEATRLADQWGQEFGLRERAQDWAETPEFVKAAKEYDAMLARGMTEEEAYNAAYAPFILNQLAVKKNDAELKRTLELYAALPVKDEVKHTLWKRQAEIEMHDESIKNLKAQRAQMARSGVAEPRLAHYDEQIYSRLNSSIKSEVANLETLITNKPESGFRDWNANVRRIANGIRAKMQEANQLVPGTYSEEEIARYVPIEPGK